jgi:hypothetical protein
MYRQNIAGSNGRPPRVKKSVSVVSDPKQQDESTISAVARATGRFSEIMRKSTQEVLSRRL